MEDYSQYKPEAYKPLAPVQGPVEDYSQYKPEPYNPKPAEFQSPDLKTPDTELTAEPYDPNPKHKGKTQDELLADPQAVTEIRDYMVDRFGTQWRDRAPEDLMDSWVSHMRWARTNDVSTLSELRHVSLAEQEVKDRTANAYKRYDELSSFLTNDGWSGAADGLFDYIGSVVLSPSTYIGAGVGKGASMLASTGARRAAQQVLLKQAYKVGGKTAAQSLLKKEAYKATLKEIGIATATDATISVAQDHAVQSALMEVGMQDDYSVFQGAVAAAGGLLGGGVAAAPYLLKGVSGLDNASRTLKASKKARRNAAKATAAPKILASASKFAKSMGDWSQAVANGQLENAPLKEMDKYVSWFFDMDDPDSVARIIIDSGADVSEENITSQIIQFAKGMPQKELDAYNTALAPTGYKFGQVLDIVAASQNFGGTSLGMASQARKYADNLAGIALANQKSSSNILKGTTQALQAPKVETTPQTTKYLASVWRRALVSHPGTTAINVVGWGEAYTMRSLAEVIHGGVLGTVGYAGKMVGRSWADPAIRQSKALLKNQSFKLRNLLDPYSSIEAWDRLVATAPKALRENHLDMLFGGVKTKGAPEAFGINENMAVRGVETYLDKASQISLLKLQDVATKTASGLSELDKLSRLEYGRGLDDILQKGDTNLLTPEMWEKSVQTLLKDTFSMDYTKGNGMLNSAAKAVETLSNAKGWGFLFPFGRFMNNNIGFFLEYNPIGFITAGSKMYKGETFTAGEKASKAAVGSLALYWLGSHAQENMASGMQWYESEENKGDVLNRQAVAPESLFRLAARMTNMALNNQEVPMELVSELGNQIGINQWSREVTGDTVLHQLIEGWRNEDSPEGRWAFQEGLRAAAEYGAGIGSGFLRPLDPLNRMVGMLGDDTGTINSAATDKRIAEPGIDRMSQELTRYVSNIFAPFLGEPTEDGGMSMGTPARSATREGDMREPNPLAGLLTRKEQPAKNDIDRLLGMVNLPPFTFDQRTAIPEFDRYVNERVAPLLNRKALALMESPGFKMMRQAEKAAEVKKILNQTRDEVKEALDKGYAGDADDRVNRARASWSALPKVERDSTKLFFNITTEDRKLSMPQINMMQRWMQNRREYSKEFQDQL
jgi:hypothetical protein